VKTSIPINSDKTFHVSKPFNNKRLKIRRRCIMINDVPDLNEQKQQSIKNNAISVSSVLTINSVLISI